MTPVRFSYPTLAVMTEEDAIHYFRYTPEGVVVQCVWSTCMSTMDRAFVFAELIAWYKDVSNRDLRANITQSEDEVAWFVASNL